MSYRSFICIREITPLPYLGGFFIWYQQAMENFSGISIIHKVIQTINVSTIYLKILFFFFFQTDSSNTDLGSEVQEMLSQPDFLATLFDLH